jgi:C4-type Zn-finger protein
MDLLRKFERTNKCPKCDSIDFTLKIQWFDDVIRTEYTCGSCNWIGVIDMANNTMPSTNHYPPYLSRSAASRQ